MRDISYRPVAYSRAEDSSSVQYQVPAIPKSSTHQSTRLGSFLHRVNVLGGIIAHALEGKSQETLHHKAPLLQQPLLQKTKIALKSGVTQKSRIVFEKTKQSAKSTKTKLKTPIGKLAAIQAIALLALFGYVQHTHQVISNADSTSTTSSKNLQRYLPVVGNSINTTAYNEADVITATKHTQLHVWVTPWNAAEVEQTKAAYASYSAFWGTVESDGSTISLKSSLNDWGAFKKTIGNQPTFLTISGDPNSTYMTLSTTSAQQQFITNALDLLNQYNFTGIDVNFEGLGVANRDIFTEFIRNLSTALHADSKQVAVTVEARIANQVPMDWHNLGLMADEIRVMVYDYHSHTTDTPGPIAPLGWVKEVVDYATQTIDPSKVIIGLGNYGYDWQAPDTDGGSWTGTGLSFERAQAVALQYKIPVLTSTGIDDRGYDIGTAPYFQYLDSQGKQHQVWFEDSASLQQKVSILDQYNLKGVIFWSVGIGDQTFWTQQNALTYTK